MQILMPHNAAGFQTINSTEKVNECSKLTSSVLLQPPLRHPLIYSLLPPFQPLIPPFCLSLAQSMSSIILTLFTKAPLSHHPPIYPDTFSRVWIFCSSNTTNIPMVARSLLRIQDVNEGFREEKKRRWLVIKGTYRLQAPGQCEPILRQLRTGNPAART